jgi:hypothetical protein
LGLCLVPGFGEAFGRLIFERKAFISDLIAGFLTRLGCQE